MNLYKRDVIRFIEERYGFKTKKVLGQNFLVDKAVIDSIVDGSFVDDTCLAIEIGPGIGVITHELCMKARKVVSIELDKTLIPILEDTLKEFDNFRVINEDVLKVDFEALIKEEMEKDPEIKHVKVIGNLPYYITTPIIMKLFEDNIKCDSITVMMQKEVADRIRAKVNTKEYGTLAIATQYYSDISKVSDASKESFYPKPEVDSTVLRLDIRDAALVNVKDKKLFFRVVKAGFAQRRKTLSNSMQTLGLLRIR